MDIEVCEREREFVWEIWILAEGECVRDMDLDRGRECVRDILIYYRGGERLCER